MAMPIRDETPSDYEAIREVNRAAFAGEVEAALVDRLRNDGLVIASRVAEFGSRIVGHILFSPVWIGSDEQEVAIASLAPMAVLPGFQNQGIGSALVRDGIEVCRRGGWQAIILVGHAHYYPRFGFSTQFVRHLASPYAGDAFMGLELAPGALTQLRGRVRYPDAFAALS